VPIRHQRWTSGRTLGVLKGQPMDDDVLYKINDALSALASDLGFGFWNEQTEDTFGEKLNEATHAVARIFYGENA
jgi:hypothetical protein